MATDQKTKDSTPATEDVTALDERAIKYVKTCKEESLKYYEEKFKRFNYFDRLYIRGASKANVPYGRANLELPLAFQQVEPFVSQMTETMIGEAPYIAYDSRTADEEDAARCITDFTQWQLDVGGFVPATIQYFRNLAKYGTAAAKIPWEVETKEIIISTPKEEVVTDPDTNEIVTDPATGRPKTQMTLDKKPQDMKVHDGPRFYNLSLFDFFIPKSATSCDVQKMPWVVHRTWRSGEDLLANPNYKNKKRIRELLKITSPDDEEDTTNTKTNLTSADEPKQVALLQNNSKGLEKFEGKFEVLEFWGDFNFQLNKFSKPALIVVVIAGDEEILLRLDDNPLKYKFKPFVMSNDYLIEGEPYGYGELDHIKGLIEESTALRNARLDVANLSLNRTWLIERSAGINLREVYTAPNNIILTNDLQGIKALDMAQVTPSSVNELARIDYDIQNTTEIVNPRQDVSNVGAAFGDTATGVNFLSSKSNLRLLTKARILEETYFKPVAEILNWYNKDMIGEEALDPESSPAALYFKSGNEDNPYGKISPQVFLTEVDFKPTSNPQKLSIGQRRENMSYLLQVVAQVEKVSPGTNNLPELLKEVYRLSGFSHPDRYVNPKQTTVLRLPTGQVVDTKGQPINVVQLGPDGKPLPPQGAPGMPGQAPPPMQ